MIIYIIGYGRSGSTIVSQELEQKLNAINLGEVKYIYRDEKDELLSEYWKDFKDRNRKFFKKNGEQLRKFDNFMGFLHWWNYEKYRLLWYDIFQLMDINPKNDLIIDSSKSTLDVFMRGLYLRKCFNEVYFVKPSRGAWNVYKSLLKGKNSNLEKGIQRHWIIRLVHATFLGFPHYLITQVLTGIYALKGSYTIRIDKMENDIENFIAKIPSHTGSESKQKLSMIYGNRSRKINSTKRI